MRLPDKFSEFTTPSNCQHEGCTKRAKWTLQISVWAKGMLKSSHDPITLQLAVKVCDDHQWQPTPNTFFVQETKRLLIAVVEATGKAEPNFDTAEFMWVPLGVMIA